MILLITPWGFPCCVRFPCVHAAATTPAQRLGASSTHFPSRISLPRYGSRVGPRHDLFEACSAFTCVTACTLALSPYFVTRLTKGFNYFVTSIVAPVASGWSILPGGLFTHWESAAFSRRTPKTEIVTSPQCWPSSNMISSLPGHGTRALAQAGNAVRHPRSTRMTISSRSSNGGSLRVLPVPVVESRYRTGSDNWLSADSAPEQYHSRGRSTLAFDLNGSFGEPSSICKASAVGREAPDAPPDTGHSLEELIR